MAKFFAQRFFNGTGISQGVFQRLKAARKMFGPQIHGIVLSPKFSMTRILRRLNHVRAEYLPPCQM
jgi:hypothetical protein